MIKKIIIYGFPHCGTSILKSILGHCKEIHEPVEESQIINNVSDSHKYTLCKSPSLLNPRYDYTDYIKIMIMRNPVYVFSSVNRRFRFVSKPGYNVRSYINALKVFDSIKHGKNNNYKLIYNDIFENNYLEIRNILDALGINYNDDIFDNSLWTNSICVNVDYSNITNTPDPFDHPEYRTHQINQPFVNNNHYSKIELTDEQIKKIKESEIINKYFDTSMIG